MIGTTFQHLRATLATGAIKSAMAFIAQLSSNSFLLHQMPMKPIVTQ